MLEARVQMPPIVVSREHADRIEQHRARFAALLPGVPISRTWAVADLLRLGLDDLEAELVELGQRPCIDDAQPAHATDTYFVALPSPPRGSRWAPREGKPARGFAGGSPSMWIPRRSRRKSRSSPQRFRASHRAVESRAALVREALARAFARGDAQAEMVRSIADVIASSEPRFTPVSRRDHAVGADPRLAVARLGALTHRNVGRAEAHGGVARVRADEGRRAETRTRHQRDAPRTPSGGRREASPACCVGCRLSAADARSLRDLPRRRCTPAGGSRWGRSGGVPHVPIAAPRCAGRARRCHRAPAARVTGDRLARGTAGRWRTASYAAPRAGAAVTIGVNARIDSDVGRAVRSGSTV